jgi:hypothetical protein
MASRLVLETLPLVADDPADVADVLAVISKLADDPGESSHSFSLTSSSSYGPFLLRSLSPAAFFFPPQPPVYGLFSSLSRSFLVSWLSSC